MQEYVVLTPLSPGHIRIERCSAEQLGSDVLHVAHGQHRGIIVRNQLPLVTPQSAKLKPADVQLAFTVFLVNKNSQEHSLEKRFLKFWFDVDFPDDAKFASAEQLFKQLLSPDQFPRDYAGFIKKMLKLLQSCNDYDKLHTLECEMTPVAADAQQLQAKPPAQHIYESSVYDRARYGYSVDSSHVQEVLEHAYPAGLTVESIAKNLQCSEEEVLMYLEHLQSEGVASQGEESQWFRMAHPLEHRVGGGDIRARDNGPTVALITALYLEKLAVDALIDNRSTYLRYKSDGQSNVYTLGEMCGRKVVATKLSALGHTREAATAAGSITTRLLGTFQSIQHVIVLGVGGGVPSYTDAEQHVRLGDIVASCTLPNREFSYVYCDKLHRNRLNHEIEGYAVNTWLQSNKILPNIARQISAESAQSPENPVWSEYLKPAMEALQDTNIDWQRPAEDKDKLYLWLSEHDVVEVAHPQQRLYPRLHLGPVGSGREVVREHSVRNEFSNRFSLRAFDQEFDAVIESIFGNRIDSWLLLRGIADYIDGTRHKHWQPYAALQAAAVAKAVVARLPADR